MLFDTDVIIWAQRRQIKAIEMLEEEPDRKVSIVSYMEFVQYARNKRELTLSRQYFQQFGFAILPMTPDISHRASSFIERFSHSHGMEITDALIAATAYEHGVALATSNDRDYKMIDGLEIVKLRVA